MESAMTNRPLLQSTATKQLQQRTSEGVQQSSSRLKYRLPWCQPHAEVMQGTADFHDQVANTRLPQAIGVADDATMLDTAVDVLDTPIGGFLGTREDAASRLPGRHDDLHQTQRKRQEAQILEQLTPHRQRVQAGIHNTFIVGAAHIGLTQKENREYGIDQKHVLDRVTLFLAALSGLFSQSCDTPSKNDVEGVS
jgi:hypothetical protein